jgi:hypothetical protein
MGFQMKGAGSFRSSGHCRVELRRIISPTADILGLGLADVEDRWRMTLPTATIIGYTRIDARITVCVKPPVQAQTVEDRLLREVGSSTTERGDTLRSQMWRKVGKRRVEGVKFDGYIYDTQKFRPHISYWRIAHVLG